MSARVAATAVAIIWLIAGAVLLFDIGRLPLRLVNRMRTRQVDAAAVVPVYWRGWGGVLVAAGLALLAYSFSR
ncbi:MAG: hypothetical protein M3Z13_00020 [Candidatus Dormibacteraeota bacterium]|nr:hypothetical protein [Candidatus Dormibacteraeota bacterium]